ncbi:hypothetical protein MCEMSEM45_00269 [Candidatus Pelagibacterales bacterium]
MTLSNLFFRIFKRIKKNEITKKLAEITKNRIYSGPYKSTYMGSNNHRGQDFPAKLLGIYECQVQEKIIELQKKKKLKYIINFGSADGFHILGLMNNKFFKNGIAFEINSKIRKDLINNIKKNNLFRKIKVFGKADFNQIIKIISIKDFKHILFLVDIEGDEFNLFNTENLKYFENSYLIIENHEVFINEKKIIKNFFKLLNKKFIVEKLNHASKNPFNIKEIQDLNEDEKWLAMSECRPKSHDWLVCYPKNI